MYVSYINFAVYIATFKMQLRLLSSVVRYELHYNTMNLTSYTSIIHEYYYYVMRLVLCNENIHIICLIHIMLLLIVGFKYYYGGES